MRVSKKEGRKFETFAPTQDDMNRACYKLVDALEDWTARHGGLLAGKVPPKSQMRVYSYPDERDITIIGVGRDKAKYGDQPIFITMDYTVLTKEDVTPLDLMRLCATYTPIVKEDKLEIIRS